MSLQPAQNAYFDELRIFLGQRRSLTSRAPVWRPELPHCLRDTKHQTLYQKAVKTSVFLICRVKPPPGFWLVPLWNCFICASGRSFRLWLEPWIMVIVIRWNSGWWDLGWATSFLNCFICGSPRCSKCQSKVLSFGPDWLLCEDSPVYSESAPGQSTHMEL